MSSNDDAGEAAGVFNESNRIDLLQPLVHHTGAAHVCEAWEGTQRVTTLFLLCLYARLQQRVRSGFRAALAPLVTSSYALGSFYSQ